MPPIPHDLAPWYRVGGRTLQFYATDDEIAEWLLEMLPPEFAPYAVLGEVWREGEWQPFEDPLEDLRASFQRHRSANHWIRSTSCRRGSGRATRSGSASAA